MPQKTIAITTSSLTAPGASALKSAFSSDGWQSTIVVVGDGEGCGLTIDEADEVIFRIGPKSFSAYRDRVLPVLRNPKHTMLLRRMIEGFDKGIQARLLGAAGVAIPETRVVTELSGLGDWLPCVLKYPIGNQGTGVFLARTGQELKKIAGEIIANTGACVQQEYIPMDSVSDKRLFVIGNQVVASMRRTALGGDFRSNLHQGGSGEVYQPTPQEETLAQRSAICLGIPFCGVDIIDSARGPLVLEANPSPGFAIADITGIPVIDKIVEYYNQGENI